MFDMKVLIKRIPVLGPAAQRMYWWFTTRRSSGFAGSAAYWEQRYESGGHSGVGSYGVFAEFKAEVLNAFVGENRVRSVIEFGCGDGNQLTLASYPRYVGFDVSSTAVARCRKRFEGDPAKSFRPMGEYSGDRADLTLSLDVIYHLVEDSIFGQYMATLFAASTRFVITYASDRDDQVTDTSHVRHRRFNEWIRQNVPTFALIRHIPNRYPYKGDYTTGSFADFFIYERQH